MFHFVKNITSWSLRIGCLAHVFHTYVYEIAETRGESMLPTLNNKYEFVHVLKKNKYGRDLNIGDVIVATKPTNSEHRICKRITGMPGDIILIDPSSSSIENKENNTKAKNSFESFLVVPRGHVWCTGDNLSLSLDSRSYSAIPMGLIEGKIIASTSIKNGMIKNSWIKNNYVKE